MPVAKCCIEKSMADKFNCPIPVLRDEQFPTYAEVHGEAFDWPVLGHSGHGS